MQYKLFTKAVESVDHEMEMTMGEGWTVHSFTQCGFIMGEDKIQRPMFAIMVQRDDSADKPAARSPMTGGLGLGRHAE